jgi:hypothetical protein
LSLTTPVIKDYDAVFPGEDWFFYWKTSASLWKTKLEELPGTGRVFIPLFWAFHTETGDSYDFADTRPETDLKKLSDCIHQMGRRPIFLLPLGPVPFLPNGGLPHFLARGQSQNQEGFSLGSLDAEGQIYQMYSFFDNRVFRAFSKYVSVLADFLTGQGLRDDVWGVRSFYLTENGPRDYFSDSSPVYEQGFSQFFSAKKSEKDFTAQFGQEGIDSILTPEQERSLSAEYNQMLNGLYLETAKESLAGNWEGVLKLGFLGGGEKSFQQRLFHKDTLSQYIKEVQECLSYDLIPSSVLLSGRIKRGILGHVLNELVVQSSMISYLESHQYEETNSGLFLPLIFFQVFHLPEFVDPDTISWADLGLWDFLQKRYNYCFLDQVDRDYSWDESLENQGEIFFFHGVCMSEELFQNVLKTFMSGGKVFLNRSGLEQPFLRRLETFFLENSLQVEKVNFCTPIHNVTLGEGRMVIFEGDKLMDLGEKEIQGFWENLINTFGIRHLFFDALEGVYVNWRVRAATYNELKYEEVRRMGIFNPTSYKKKMKITVPKNFSLVKVLDENNTTIKTSPHEIDLEMLPEGVVFMDFGVFS